VDNIAVGLIGFVSGITLVLVLITYNKLVYVQRHVLLILRHLNIDPTKLPELSDRVKELARDPARKIAAIKALRDETGAGLAEAKDAVESYIRTLDR
jgi:hypothetical protein